MQSSIFLQITYYVAPSTVGLQEVKLYTSLHHSPLPV